MQSNWSHIKDCISSSSSSALPNGSVSLHPTSVAGVMPPHHPNPNKITALQSHTDLCLLLLLYMRHTLVYRHLREALWCADSLERAWNFLSNVTSFSCRHFIAYLQMLEVTHFKIHFVGFVFAFIHTTIHTLLVSPVHHSFIGCL